MKKRTKRDEVFMVKLSKEERDMLDRLAENIANQGGSVSRSGIVRTLIRNAARKEIAA